MIFFSTVNEEVQAISPSDDIQPQDETTQNEPVSDIINNSPDPEVKKKGNNSNKQVKERTCHPLFYKIFKSFIMIVKGWKTYMKYDVAFAGLGLAAVYMTVMGFDNITVGKC
jgi:iron-regulated transporter 1